MKKIKRSLNCIQKFMKVCYQTLIIVCFSAVTAYGNDPSFTATFAALASLTTTTVYSITITTAVSGGNITSDGGAAITARGICWAITSNPTISDTKTTNGTGIGSFVSSLNALLPGTTYYVRAYATNSEGTAYGNEMFFTTNTTVPTLTTAAISGKTMTTAISGGNITSDGGTAVTARGVCWATTSFPTISDSKTTDGTGTGSYISNLTGLLPGTSYYARAYATNSAGTEYGNSVLFTTYTCEVPSLTTTAVTSITATSAVLGGNITIDGGCEVSSRGVCWATTPNPTTSSDMTYLGSGIGTFTTTIHSLLPGTTYYVRAFGKNTAGTAYGNEVSFTTNPVVVPTLTTYENGSIYQTSAVSGGTITDGGGSSVTARGVCWATISNPTTADSKTVNGTGTGSFTSVLTGLTPVTTYYVRAYATNSAGTAYGNEILITTLPITTAIIFTTTVSSILTTTAVSGGNITSDNGGPVTARGVCWDTHANPLISDSKTIDGSGTGSFVSNLAALLPGTTYYVRAYATNIAGTAYGNNVTFTTASIVIPTLTTTVVTSISLTTAISGGNITSDGGGTVSARGICWSTAANPTIADTKTIEGTGIGNFISTLSGLLPGTTYHVRAYATNIAGTAYGNDLTFTTNPVSCPTLTTTPVTFISATTAVSGGNITSDGGGIVTDRGVCWGINSDVNLNDCTHDGTGTGSFVSTLTGLLPGTCYHVRAYATNSAGTCYGSDLYFCILPITLPTLTTTVVTSITQTTAVSSGNISTDGGGTVTARGVCWATTTNPTITNSRTTDGTGTGSFVSNLTGLLPGTPYYVRAYATNSAGTAYGNEISFKTYNSDAIQDIDGNYYNIVTIGSQVWITENLKTTRYYDGTAIPLVTDNMAWSTATTPAYCWFENNPTSYKDLYGGLYNWYAVNTGKLCPAGWHVPADVEWAILFNNLGGATVAGGKLKSTGTLQGGDGLWYSPNTGATNESGFTALPAGGRVADEGYQGIFLTLGFSSYFWSNSETSPDSPIYYYLWNQSESANKSTFLRQTGFSIRCLKDNIPSGTHFVPVWWPGSGMDHMNLYALTAKLDNIDLQPGDEIGIFDGTACVGMGTITQVLNGTTVYLSMVASKDDPDTPAKDGYTQGNPVTYMVWDLSATKEIGNAVATYTSGVGFFSPGTTSTFNLNALTSITQDIGLMAGWNIMSFAGEPDNMSLSSIVNSLKIAGTLVKIQDEKGNAIEQLPAPIGWVDNIGLMKVSEGYKIKVSANTTLSGVTGIPVILPYTITLETGWNIMGYPSMNSQSAMAAFQALINAGTLLKVQDEKGNAIEQLPAPIGWVDNIHTLAPGEGYKVKVSAATSITINNSGKGEYEIAEFVTLIKPSHFKPAYSGNGFDHMNIYVKEATIGGAGIKPGDEIGVFDGGVCVGAVVVEDPNSDYIMVTASLDDPTTTETDGFIAGHNFTLKLWDRQSGIERNTQNMQFEKGSGKLFERLGTSVLAVDFETKAYTSLGDAYPNPSTDKTTFTFQLDRESKVKLEIYNMKGDLIKLLVDDNKSGGIHTIEWDNRSANGTSVISGIYFYKLILNNFTQTKQLIIH